MFWKKLKPLPIARLFLGATDVDEKLGEEVAAKTNIAMATALAGVQELRGRQIKLSVVITVDEILGEP